MQRLGASWAAVILLAAPALTQAQTPDTVYRAALSDLQRIDSQVLDTGWRLAAANGQYCGGAVPQVGLRLHDMASYSDPAQARSALGLTGDFAVLAVAAGSPSAAAGIRPGAEITRLDDTPLAARPAKGALDWERLAGIEADIAASLGANGEVIIGLADGSHHHVTGVPACPSRFEVDTTDDGASADGERVIIGRKFAGLAYEPGLFAAAIAHELAHNLLGHSAWLSRNGRKQRNIRITEREADRLAPWLLANAGYDPKAAVRLMERWGPKHGGGVFRKRTHEGWDERAKRIASEAAIVEQKLSDEGTADWPRHFRREISE